MSAVTPCFTPGTLIATARGWQPVELLIRGDRLVTRDNGLKRIEWAGRRDVTFDDLQDEPGLSPVVIVKGALGDDYPSRDMLVSPEHRFLRRDPWGEEVLVAARHLTFLPGIARVKALGVSYLHVLLAAHEVILANGVWTESFHPEDTTLKGLAGVTRREILNLFPEIETQSAAKRFPPARRIRQSRFER